MKLKKLTLLILLIFTHNAFANQISIDIGQTSTNFNYFSIPKSDSDQINISSDETITSYRLTGFINTQSLNQWYFLFAPLEASYKFRSDKNFTFNKSNFSQGVDTKVKYKFNSYRIGYMWNFGTANLKYWLGVVGKVRDADIAVEQATVKDNYDNIGIVPLFSFGFDFKIFENFSLYSHTDGLASSRGSAYDSQLELKYDFNPLSISLGKRILGGGADNDKVYNFAQFDTYYLKTTYNF